MQLPFSQASENNKDPILRVLSRVFADRRSVLEIGSGTGQHAAYFSAALPHLRWQPTELESNLPTLSPRCEQATQENLAAPIAFDVRERHWPPSQVDAVFTANTLHIMSASSVQAFFCGLGELAAQDLCLAVYGPFNYAGRYTSDSNARFDQWLAQRDPESAIRDFEWVDALAGEAGLILQEDNEMPANNRILVWRGAG